jgi:hypothetical protein
MTYDYDAALEIAQKHRAEPILDLVDWSTNYEWSDPGHPLRAFYALAKIEDFDCVYTIPVGATFGYTELDLIGKALSCYATRPQDVENFLRELKESERE